MAKFNVGDYILVTQITDSTGVVDTKHFYNKYVGKKGVIVGEVDEDTGLFSVKLDGVKDSKGFRQFEVRYVEMENV